MKNRKIWKSGAVILSLLLIYNLIAFPVYGNEIQKDLFTEEEQAYIEKESVLKVGYVCDRRPVSYQGENGELAGISRQIFDKISEISGLNFEYVALPPGDITYEYLLNEGFDLVTSVEYNKENQNARGILMSDPYLSSRKVIVAKEGLNLRKDAHFTVAISTGSQTLKKVLTNQYPNFKLVNYPSIEDCLKAVNQGDADLLIQNQYVVEYWLYKPIYNDLVVIPMLEMLDQLCFSAVVPLEITNDEDPVWREKKQQISIINKAIAQMSEGEVSGYIIGSTLEDMYKYSISDFLYQYRYTVLILGIAFVVICILVYVAIHFRIRSIRDRSDAKAKGDFLSAMSHEIRTPLNGLISLNYLMSQNVDDKEKIKNYLQQSSTVSQYLLALVNNVLDMSKLQENKIALEHEPVDLQLLLETVESVERGSMEEKEIKFRSDVSLSYPHILGDEVRIQQILINLLDNARKYTEAGGSVTVTVSQSWNLEGDIITRIEVADDGCGMSEEFQKKVFDPFAQERDTVSKGNEGTGLGLSISSMLAERMGGTLSLESRLKEGSRFIFTFPARPAKPGGEDAASVETQKSSTHDRPHILIAEDNELNGEILTELLEEEGFPVLLVENGKKAVEAFAASAVGEYGVILMDLLMPEMNGFEAAKAIRSLDRADAGSVKIFASTANTMQKDRAKAFESGMDDFIAKPIDIGDLIKKLQN